MDIDFYDINEFNKELQDFKDIIENEDNKKILEYSSKRLEELKEEFKDIQIHQIQNDGKLPADKWLKKDFLEKEIAKHEEKISKIEEEKKEAEKKLAEKRLEKEDIKRELNLEEAKIEIEIAKLQKEWSKAASELNENNEKIKQIRIANRELPEDSEELQNNLKEILEIQNKNQELQNTMKENVITSQKGMDLNKRKREIVSMRNLLESEKVLEGITKESKKDPKKEDPKKEDPKKEEPKKENPKKEDPKKEEPKKENPNKEDPKKEDPNKEDPKKEDPKKEDPKKEDPKKENPKKSMPDKVSRIYISAVTNNAVVDYAGKDYSQIADLKYSENLREEGGELSEKLFEILEKNDINLSTRTFRRLDPTIVNILKNDEEMLLEYAMAIEDHADLPFEVVYDLKNMDKADLMFDTDKNKMSRLARTAFRSRNVTIEKDGLFKRVKERIKSIFNKSERKALVEANRADELLDQYETKQKPIEEHVRNGKEPFAIDHKKAEQRVRESAEVHEKEKDEFAGEEALDDKGFEMDDN